MQISKFIQMLEEAKKKYGDKEIKAMYTDDELYSYEEEISTSIDFNNDCIFIRI
jgi:hypothetical protein